MKYIKVGDDVMCKEEDIVMVLHARKAAARNLLRDKANQAPNTIYDICGGKKRQTLIVLRDGKMVVTNYAFNLVINRINDQTIENEID